MDEQYYPTHEEISRANALGKYKLGLESIGASLGYEGELILA